MFKLELPAAAGRVWTSLRVQNSKRTSFRGVQNPPHFEFYLQDPHQVLTVKIGGKSLMLPAEEKQSLRNTPGRALKGNYFI